MISVIMLTYNRAAMVEHMIDCVLAQTFKNFEYVIVDNGSTDHTSMILKKYQEKDKRIKLISCVKPVTIGAARNIGIGQARGEYITFVDDDDRLSIHYLEYLMGLIMEFNAQIAVAGTEEECDGIVRPQCVFPERTCISGEQAVYELLQRKRIRAGTAAKIVLRSIFEKHPFPVDCIHEDIRVTYRHLGEAQRVAMGGKPVYCICRHGGNISMFTSDKTQWTGEKLREYISAFKERECYVSKYFPKLRDYVEYCTYSYEISMCRQLIENPPLGTGEILREMMEDLMEDREKIMKYAFLTDTESMYMNQKKLGKIEGNV